MVKNIKIRKSGNYPDLLKTKSIPINPADTRTIVLCSGTGGGGIGSEQVPLSSEANTVIAPGFDEISLP
jgi:hypothetical protein